MSAESVATVRAGMEHFFRTGEPAWHTMAADVEVRDHDIMDGSEYHGREGIGRWLSNWSEAWSDFRMEPEDYIDGGDCVIAVVHMRATGAGSGSEVDRQDAILCRLRDGKVASMDYYNNVPQAVAAAGL